MSKCNCSKTQYTTSVVPSGQTYQYQPTATTSTGNCGCSGCHHHCGGCSGGCGSTCGGGCGGCGCSYGSVAGAYTGCIVIPLPLALPAGFVPITTY